MAGGIDTSFRKPRRLRGTPALKYISALSFASVFVGGLIGYFLYTRPSLKRIDDRFFSKEEEEKEKLDREERAYMLDQSLIGQKTSSDIRRSLRHKKKYETEL